MLAGAFLSTEDPESLHAPGEQKRCGDGGDDPSGRMSLVVLMRLLRSGLRPQSASQWIVCIMHTNRLAATAKPCQRYQ